MLDSFDALKLFCHLFAYVSYVLALRISDCLLHSQTLPTTMHATPTPRNEGNVITIYHMHIFHAVALERLFVLTIKGSTLK